jgi:hypothetical protein
MALGALLAETKAKYGFISIGKLGGLVTQIAVEHHLGLKGIQLSRPLSPSAVERARKLIAILILLDLEILIENVIGLGICDTLFPANRANVAFLNDDADKYHFCLAQWVVPPVFDPEKLMELPKEAIFPFLSKTRINHGSFGIVYKVRIANGHLLDYGVSWIYPLMNLKVDRIGKRLCAKVNRGWRQGTG